MGGKELRSFVVGEEVLVSFTNPGSSSACAKVESVTRRRLNGVRSAVIQLNFGKIPYAGKRNGYYIQDATKTNWKFCGPVLVGKKKAAEVVCEEEQFLIYRGARS